MTGDPVEELPPIPPKLVASLQAFVGGDGRLTVLTGAGISAASGIPTFRGPEGYWTVGSRNYQPEQIGTHGMFSQRPREVWKWYLFRRGVCSRAQPNPGHRSIVRIERRLGDRFRLITQNVDGLHTRAGSSFELSYHIHGNLEQVRCSQACTDEILPFPEGVSAVERGGDLPEAQWDRLRCGRCGALLRPHVLWFDEQYNERWYRWDSSVAAALQTDLLIIVGTAGATTLPNVVVEAVASRGGLIIDVNLRDNRFARVARQLGGHALCGPAGELLPEMADALDA